MALGNRLHLLIFTWPHLNSDVSLEEGNIKRIIVSVLVLCSTSALHNHNEQFFQVGLLDRPLISLGLALSPSSTSVSSDMVLCKCFFG